MTHKTYGISPAKIGNQDGFRLPRAFSKDYPELVKASGEVEVLDDNTLLVRLEPASVAEATSVVHPSTTSGAHNAISPTQRARDILLLTIFENCQLVN